MSSRKNLRTEITWCIIHILTKRVANDRNISSRRSFVYPRFFFLTYLLAASTSCSSASSQEACSINRDADKRKRNGLRRDLKNDLESDRICAPVRGGYHVVGGRGEGGKGGRGWESGDELDCSFPDSSITLHAFNSPSLLPHPQTPTTQFLRPY